ncbi:uncharacterized protein [Mytilus edulis]|uniref:uncharacterized protein n=1 Tax=Mytilus edulis TaxID=6550 RepID=UPI0039EE00F6
MGWTCAVCTNTSRNTQNLSFFRIPKNNLRKKWLNALNLEEEDVNTGTRICSEHFFAGEKVLSNGIPDLSIGKQIGKKCERKTQKIEKKSKVKLNGLVAEEFSTHFNNESPSQLPSMPSGYACQPQSKATDNETEHNKLKEKIRDLEKALEQEKNINTNLLNEKNMLSNKLFRYNNFKNSDTKIKELTGLPDNHTFDILFTLFDKPKQYWSLYDKKILDGNFGRHRALSPQDEFFMYLLRLRQDISETVLASMFNVSISTVPCILSTWACHMKLTFSKINMNPTMDELQTLCSP